MQLLFKDQVKTFIASLLRWQLRWYKYGMISTTLVIMYCLVKPYLAKLSLFTLIWQVCYAENVM